MTDEQEPEQLLTNKQLDQLAFEIPHIRAWLNAVEREIETQLMLGVKFENAQLVPKRAIRKWRLDLAGMIKVLRRFGKLDEIAPREPLSPAACEKAFGKKNISALKDKEGNSYIIAESSGMKVAYTHPEGDGE